jgi:type I restriction enzyme, R subunit
MSQFGFLGPEFPEVFDHAAKAEALALSDPRAACFYSRLALEVAVAWLYSHEGALREPFENTLAARIYETSFRKLVGESLIAKARIVKDLGNNAVHETKVVPSQTAIVALRELFHICYWLVRTYGRKARPDPNLSFSPEALPKTHQVSAASLAQLREAANAFVDAVKARDEALAARAASEDERAGLEAELAAVRSEIAAVKAANASVADTHDYDEARTRDYFIDLLLHEAGWPLDQTQDREFPVQGMPNPKGKGFVDYVLWDDDGKPLGLVEAKRTRRDPRVGQQQAKLYADCLEAAYGQRPIIFYSNGYEHWMWDDVNAPPRPMQGFLSKDELRLSIQRRTTRRPPSALEIDGDIVERYYQHRAIRRVVESFDRDGLRKSLVVMATGAGKTRTVVALCDLLMRANWIKRVLFLADRRALVRQAVNAFKQHLPSATTVNLVTEPGADGRVYVSTYPTMMGLIDESAGGVRKFGVGYFDLIVIDEAHRSVYRKYNSIFSYFDSFLVGLTATPKDEIDRDTYKLFDLQRGIPTDVYSLDEAVEDDYLVPPRAISVPLKFQREGITYDDLSDEEKEEWDEIEWSDNGPSPTRIESGALHTWLFNANTVDKVLEYLMTFGLKVAGGDRLGKTIIFAKNHEHAKFIVQRFDINYPHLKGEFARIIDVRTEYAESLIGDFSAPEKAPHIAVSVDMLDTGIDIPEIVNLVFFKVVRSNTKFWQMLGRGTRLRPDLFGPGLRKEFFYVFDFCMNFEFFKQDVRASDPSIAESLTKRLFAGRVELLDELKQRDENLDLATVACDTAEHLEAEVRGMPLDNFLVRPHRKLVEKYREAEAWNTWSLSARTELLDSLAGLPSSYADDDLDAKEFDLLLLRADLALLRSDKRFESLRTKIIEFARLLEPLSNIPMVNAELELILEIQTDDYWQSVTVPMLEAVRRHLRALIKLIDVKKRALIYSDFTDEMGVGSEIEIIETPAGADIERFRKQARRFLRDHEDHITIQRVRRNERLTPTDLGELERMFAGAGFNQADVDAGGRAAGGLGLLVRSLVGLDRGAAKAAFTHFLAGRPLSANQLEFVNVLIEHLTAEGIVDPGLLFESPFTDMDPLGVAGVFPEPEVREIVAILEDVKKRAAA